jgi:flavin reductase (DIM6/NTAB) family NADH-FMN oxidoreductase RutF
VNQIPSPLQLPVTVDAAAFKGAMSAVPSPVSVVTTYDGQPHGTTVGAFMSLSLEPSMVLISLHKTSALCEVLRQTERFGLNVLGKAQVGIATQFSQKGIDRWAGIEWELVNGAPRLAGSASFVACYVFQVISAGDHIIVTGLVDHAENTTEPGLVYQHREFGTFTALS